MYNHVSQVIYFLNPSYAKRGFKAPSVDSVMDGSCGELHSLPSILQLFPDIPVLLSDAAMDLRPDGDWGRAGSSWLILDERVFLVSCEGQGVFRNSSRLVALTGLLLRAALKKGCDPSRQGLPAGQG